MDLKTFKRGSVIFRQGDAGDCMYSVEYGVVCIFWDYGGENEKKIAELYPGQLFGEMGLLDQAPRSATAVAMEDDTLVNVIPEADFMRYFEERTDKILLLMQQMCNRLRRTTRDYMEACRTVYEAAEAEKSGSDKSSGLVERIKKFCAQYKGFNFYAHT